MSQSRHDPGDQESMRLGVFDTVNTPQRFNLLKLLGIVLEHVDSVDGEWTVRRSQGYGPRVNELDELLDTQASVSVRLAELASLAVGVDEWFYSLDVTSSDTSAILGIADSSYMFVEGSADMLDEVAACFDETRPL